MTMTERSENLPTAPVSPGPHGGRSVQFVAGKEATYRSSSRITVRRLLALALLLVCVTLAMLTSLLFLASRRDPSQMMGMVRTLPEHVSSHSLMLLGGVAALFLIAIVIALIGLAFYIVNTLTHPQRHEPFIPLTPFVLDLPAEEVIFPPLHGDYQVRGIYIASRDATTTVIISPGYRRGFTDVLGMCKHLWTAGHNVLAFEYYGHGSVVGVPVTLGYREVNDFLGAVSYARQRAPEARIGALGYSMGGAVTIMGSAQTPEVLAVVADSAFASHWSAVEMAVRQTLHLPANTFRKAMKVLRWITDIVLVWRAGYHFHQVEPYREIARLAPRPVLLIHGLSDTVVHPDDSVRLYQAAGRPKALWHLPGTQHIKSYFTDSVKYTSRVLGFFDRYLKQPALTAQESDTRPEEEAAELLPEQESNTVSSFGMEPITAYSWQEPVLSPAPARQPAYSALGLAYGHLVYRFRWAIIALWVVLIFGSLPLAGKVQTVLQNSGYSISGSESQTVDSILTSKLHQPATQILAVFQSSTTSVSDPAYQRELHDFMARARNFAHVSSVTQASVGKDGRSALVVIGFDQDKDTVAQYIPALRRIVPSAESGPAQVYLTGDSAAANETQLDTQSDTETAELIALPLTLLVLLIVFGSVVAGLMPLLLAAVAVPGSLAIIYLIARHIQTNIFIQSLASIIGLGLSIDYSLFLIRRFREELAQGCAVPVALARTIATAGEAILFSAITVAIGFAGLLFIGIQIMTSFGIGGITVASMAALAAMTLLPAMLGVLGHRINSLSLRRRRWPVATQAGRKSASTFWHSWALFVMKRPVLIILLMMVVLLGLGWPALSLTPGLPGASSLPANSQARRGSDILTQQFPAVNQDPIDLIVQTADGSSILTAQNTRRIAAVTQEIAHQPHVTDVISLTRVPSSPGGQTFDEQQLLHLYSRGSYQNIPALRQFVASVTAGNTTLITVRADTVAGSHDDEILIDRLRSLSPQVKQGLIIRVGGARAINLDFDRALYGNFFRALIFILIATYILLLFTFRSILLPLKAILMNILSISGAYGALVFIFQQGHFENLLGFTASGFIDRFIPILLFCVLFGLSMDYEVFLLTRMREEWQQTGENRLAVARGLEKTGGVITSAALLFIIVSGSFMFTQLIVTKELGLGITIAVFVDATLIRSLLVPATMQLLGKWNWWPGNWSHRRTPRLAQVQTQETDLAHSSPGASRVFAVFTGYPKAYWFLLLGTLINGTATFVLPFESLYLVSERHFTVSQAAAIVALYGIGSCISALLGGILADKIGRRPTILSGLLCLAATTFGLAFAQDARLIALLTFLMGFWISWYRPASNAILADLLPQERQAQANGLIYWAYNLGMAVSPLLASMLVPSIGYTILFCVDGIGTVLFCLLIFLGLPETRPTVVTSARSLLSHSTPRTGRHSVWRDGRFLLFTGLSFLLTSVYFQSISTLPADMQAHGLDAFHYGLAISVNGLVVILLSLPLSNLLARMAPFKGLAVSAVLLGAGFGLVALADRLFAFPVYAGSVLVWTLGEILFVPVTATIVALLSPLPQRGLYQGVARTSWGLSAFAGPLVGGIILQAWGSALWIGCAVLGVLLAGSFLLLGRMQSASPREEETLAPVSDTFASQSVSPPETEIYLAKREKSVTTARKQKAPEQGKVREHPTLSAPVPQATTPAKGLSLTHQAAVEQSLMQMVAHILEIPPEQVRGTGDFFEYGGDSHSLDALLSAVASQWHVQISANDVFDHSVIFHLAAIILQKQQEHEREGVLV